MKLIGEQRQSNIIWWGALSVILLVVVFVASGGGTKLRNTITTALTKNGTVQLAPAAGRSQLVSPLRISNTTLGGRVQSALVSVTVTTPNDDERMTPETGTGFVWDAAGHVMLPARLVSAARRVITTLPTDNTIEGRVIGVDASTNVAVVRLERLPTDSAPITHGSPAITTNMPVFVLWYNATGQVEIQRAKIVATGRLLPIGTITSPSGISHVALPDVLKIVLIGNQSTAIPENALVIDEAGVLVGIILPYRESDAAAYYAMPHDILRRVVDEVIATGQYRHPWLGISVRTVTPELQKVLGAPITKGVQILAVLPGSPAERAGLHGSTTLVRIEERITYTGGDILTAINGQRLTTADDLIRYLVRNTRVGETLTLEYVRNGQAQTTTIVVGARPETPILD